MHWSKLTKITTAAVAIVLIASLTACGSKPAGHEGSDPTIRLSLDWSTLIAYHAPIVLAEEEGIFEKHGVNVSQSFTAGSKDAVLAVGTNQSDIAWADLSTSAASILSGLPAKAIATVQAKNSQGLTVLEDTTLNSAKDVVGLRIGSTPGGSDSTLIGAFLEKNGIAKDQVTIVNLPGNGKFAALMAGNVDAISGQVYYYVSSSVAEGKPAHGKSYSEMGVDTLDHGFVANDQFLSAHPDAATNFLAAYREALQKTIEDPAAACAKIAPLSDGALSVKACETQLELWLPLVTPVDDPAWGTNDLTKWSDTIATLKTFGGATGSVEPTAMFTNDYLPKKVQ
ncbi:ABC transporter substrate-binding protein [Saccharopolyspora hattusasensis]|uniref:ABC transporter substrate-binding protein n=1 Tax=Saccharopolyspora hattusasensis TaxID=1128679 RepID=UPI003D979E66